MSKHRQVLDPYGGPNPLIDKMIGNAYETVREVAHSIAFIKHVSHHLESIFIVSKNIDSIEFANENVELLEQVANLSTELQALYSNLDGLVAVSLRLDDLMELRNSLPAMLELKENVPVFNEIHSNLQDILAVAGSLSAINDVSESLGSIQTILDNLNGLIEISDNINELTALASNLTQLLEIQANITPLLDIHSNLSQILGVGNNIDEILTVANDIQAILNVNDELALINIINTNLSAITNVAEHVDEIVDVHSNMNSVVGVYDKLAEIQAIYDNLPTLLTLNPSEDPEPDTVVLRDATGRSKSSDPVDELDTVNLRTALDVARQDTLRSLTAVHELPLPDAGLCVVASYGVRTFGRISAAVYDTVNQEIIIYELNDGSWEAISSPQPHAITDQNTQVGLCAISRTNWATVIWDGVALTVYGFNRGTDTWTQLNTPYPLSAIAGDLININYLSPDKFIVSAEGGGGTVQAFEWDGTQITPYGAGLQLGGDISSAAYVCSVAMTESRIAVLYRNTSYVYVIQAFDFNNATMEWEPGAVSTGIDSISGGVQFHGKRLVALDEHTVCIPQPSGLQATGTQGATAFRLGIDGWRIASNSVYVDDKISGILWNDVVYAGGNCLVGVIRDRDDTTLKFLRLVQFQFGYTGAPSPSDLDISG